MLVGSYLEKVGGHFVQKCPNKYAQINLYNLMT